MNILGFRHGFYKEVDSDVDPKEVVSRDVDSVIVPKEVDSDVDPKEVVSRDVDSAIIPKEDVSKYRNAKKSHSRTSTAKNPP